MQILATVEDWQLEYGIKACGLLHQAKMQLECDLFPFCSTDVVAASAGKKRTGTDVLTHSP